jgi:hypothetical protein
MISENLTEQQKELLRILVSMHEYSGGSEFKFVRSLTSSGLCYPGGISVRVENDNTDFLRLDRENLIDFICTSPNVYSGKPTQLGITVVRREGELPEAEALRQVKPSGEQGTGLQGAAGAAAAADITEEANRARVDGATTVKIKGILARNIDRLRRDCGWSFDLLSEKTGLDKKLILGHVNEGKPAQVRTVKTYADTFAKALSRPVSAAELESNIINTAETPPA